MKQNKTTEEPDNLEVKNYRLLKVFGLIDCLTSLHKLKFYSLTSVQSYFSGCYVELHFCSISSRLPHVPGTHSVPHFHEITADKHITHMQFGSVQFELGLILSKSVMR
jgi:hypothetical protein